MGEPLVIRSGTLTRHTAVATYRGLSLALALGQIRHDLLTALSEITRDRDIVGFEFARHLVYLVNEPSLVRHVLRHNEAFVKPDLGTRFRLWFDPDGLVTAATFRSMAVGAFDRTRIDATVAAIDRVVTGMYPRLDFHAIRQEPLDVSQLAMRLSLLVSSRVLFSANLGAEIDTIIRCLDTVQDYYAGRPVAVALGLSDAIPSRKGIAARSAVGILRQSVQRIVDARRVEPSISSHDLLSDLLAAGEEGALTRGLIRNVVMAALLSSYETTGCALTWSLICLAKHSVHLDAIATEVRSLPDHLTCPADLAELGHTRRVFKEALRLFPPSWIIMRETREPQCVGPYFLRAGAQVLVSPYLLHRHPRYWVNGDVFDPDRFTNSSGDGRSDAYIPFGGGPHACFGAQFATLVAQIVLARLAGRYAFRPHAATVVRPRPLISLQPRDRFYIVPTRRDSSEFHTEAPQ
jgi:cytochrome P450